MTRRHVLRLWQHKSCYDKAASTSSTTSYWFRLWRGVHWCNHYWTPGISLYFCDKHTIAHSDMILECHACTAVRNVTTGPLRPDDSTRRADEHFGIYYATVSARCRIVGWSIDSRSWHAKFVENKNRPQSSGSRRRSSATRWCPRCRSVVCTHRHKDRLGLAVYSSQQHVDTSTWCRLLHLVSECHTSAVQRLRNCQSASNHVVGLRCW